MSSVLRLLVVDAYDADGRAAIKSAGATAAGQLYARVLRAIEPGAAIEVVEMMGARTQLPDRVAIAEFDGIVWTGSNLTIHKPTATVRPQIELAQSAYAAGVPQFGSCWAIHVAVVAAGGTCAANPNGREFGIVGVTATAEGAVHGLLRGRPKDFQSFSSHEDMVVSLPAGTTHLARNDFTEIQAIEVRSGRGVFWAVQYHPEYDLHEIASLAELRGEQLVEQGRFGSVQERQAFVRDCRALYQNPGDENAARRQNVSAELRDEMLRRLEIRNWLDMQVQAATIHR